MTFKIIYGSRGIGKTQLLVKEMIDNNVHHIFCGNPEKMRERVHYAGGRDIAVYHYSDVETMEELDAQDIAYYLDDMDAFMKHTHPGCKKATMNLEGND